jgi:hypothetical protein
MPGLELRAYFNLSPWKKLNVPTVKKCSYSATGRRSEAEGLVLVQKLEALFIGALLIAQSLHWLNVCWFKFVTFYVGKLYVTGNIFLQFSMHNSC